jgi:hypothetical protein
VDDRTGRAAAIERIDWSLDEIAGNDEAEGRE